MKAVYDIKLKRDLFEILTVTGSTHGFAPHMHGSPGALRIDTGEKHVFMYGRDFHLRRGDTLFIPERLSHSCRVDEGKSVSYTVLTLHDPQAVTEDMLLDELRKADVQAGDMGALYRRIIKGSAEPAHRDSRIMELMEYIEQNCIDEISVKHLAEHAGLSVHHLVHRFTAEAGISLHRYIIQCRLKQIRRSMAAVTDTGAMALDWGFFDQSHFIRHFRRHTGTTPGRWMESLTIL
jgi:AraC-like DNA-binding protein